MNRSARVFAVVSLVLAAAAAPVHPEEGARGGDWDRADAAAYLDERMDVWFAKGKKLKTGEGETVCASCHTTVPYVLSRPALRRLMRVSSPTPQEQRLVEEATRRVQTYGAHQLLYDFDETKKTESGGTEAVLNALILSSADAAQNRKTPSAATSAAFRRMWSTQRADGAWTWLDFGLEPFETGDAAYFGATLAALAVGALPERAVHGPVEVRAAVDRLRGYLKERFAGQNLFNRVWLLLASTRLEGLVTRGEREALVAELQSRQREDGGWALETLGAWRWGKSAAPFAPPGKPDAALLAKSDGYATGLIAHALRRAGVRPDRPPLQRGLAWLRANQQEVQVGERPHRAWRAHSLNYDREHGGEKGEPWRRMFMSDSATAFAVLALSGAR